MTSKADAALRKSGRLKSAVVYQAADEAHRRAESAHLRADATHKAIHNLGQFRPAKAPVERKSCGPPIHESTHESKDQLLCELELQHTVSIEQIR
ncbi:MAG TPA: hypothetical protein VGI88_02245, partial [Verrucomicrobiae bacterium]